jgi:hypothetical protein
MSSSHGRADQEGTGLKPESGNRRRRREIETETLASATRNRDGKLSAAARNRVEKVSTDDAVARRACVCEAFAMRSRGRYQFRDGFGFCERIVMDSVEDTCEGRQQVLPRATHLGQARRRTKRYLFTWRWQGSNLDEKTGAKTDGPTRSLIFFIIRYRLAHLPVRYNGYFLLNIFML